MLGNDNLDGLFNEVDKIGEVFADTTYNQTILLEENTNKDDTVIHFDSNVNCEKQRID